MLDLTRQGDDAVLVRHLQAVGVDPERTQDDAAADLFRDYSSSRTNADEVGAGDDADEAAGGVDDGEPADPGVLYERGGVPPKRWARPS